MKKVIFIILFFVIPAGVTIINCQTMYNRRFLPEFGYGFRAGANYATQITPDNDGAFNSYRILGLAAGGYYNYFINRDIALQVELIASWKGSHWKENFYAQDEKRDILTYIDLPLLVRYQPLGMLNVHLGPQISYLARAMQYDYSTGVTEAIDHFYKMIDAGILAGVELNLENNINITLRYGQSLISAYKSEGYNFDSFNSYLQVTAGYRFEKKSKLQSKSRSSIRRK